MGLLMAGALLPPEILNPELAIQPAASEGKSWFNRLTGRWLG
jgi:cell division protein FtsA